MVDLVKLRKKAKEKKEKAEEPLERPAPPPGERRESAAVAAVQPEPKKESAAVPAASPGEAPGAPDRLGKFLETAGTKRDTGQAAPVEAPRAQREVLTFVIDREHYAVDIESVISIISPKAVTRVPNADALIVGIISLRGTVVTLLDLRRKLGHGQTVAGGADRRVIIIDRESEPIGFEVDRVLRVVKVDPEEIEPHPVVHASEADEAIQGVFRHNDALTILLDFAKLLGSRGTESVIRDRSAGVGAPRT